MLTFVRFVASAIGVWLILFCSSDFANGALYEGSSCRMKDGTPGICSRIPACKVIDEALMKRKFPLQNLVRCTFIGNDEVICCPSDANVTTTTQDTFILKPAESTRESVASVPLNSASNIPSSTLNLEKEVTVGNIHITNDAEFIDLTKVVGKSPVSFDPAVIFANDKRTTKRPTAWIRDLKVTDPTPKWLPANRPSKLTSVQPEPSFEQNFNNFPNPRENDLKPNPRLPPNERRSPFWSGFNWRQTVPSEPWRVQTTPRSRGAPPIHLAPQPWNPLASPWENVNGVITVPTPSTRRTTTRPTKTTTQRRENLNFDTANTIVFPDSDLFSIYARETTTTTNRPTATAVNPLNNPLTNPSFPFSSSVLDPWMANVLLEASRLSTPSTLTSTTSTTPSTFQNFPGPNKSPEDNNVLSPSPIPRDPVTVRPSPVSRAGGRKADKVCAQYVDEFVKIPKSPEFQILDGIPAELGEFPHMAALGYLGEAGGENAYQFDCGGSLISDRYVLTAAHCVNRRERWPSIIRLGTISVVETTDEMLDVGIEDIILHPEYKSSRTYHDIALIRLNTTLRFDTRIIYPACLNTDAMDTDDELPVVATGWGSTSTETRKKSNFLLKVNLTTVRFESCRKEYEDYPKTRRLPEGLNNGQMCAFDKNLKKDTCEGDSGGPLQIQLESGLSRVLGITSFGIFCASSIPSVYARVVFYLEWLESIVWPGNV